MSLFRSPALFFLIAFVASYNNIFPGSSTTLALGDYMVEGKVLNRNFLTAILADLFITHPYIPSIEFDSATEIFGYVSHKPDN